MFICQAVALYQDKDLLITNQIVPPKGIEAEAKATYNRLAGNYYSLKHPTSFAFDRSIRAYLRSHRALGENVGVHLDVGC